MRRKTRIALGLLVTIGLLVGGVGGVQATHDNSNWGGDAGDSDQEDCSVGHINPHDDGDTREAPDDCGVNRGDL